jgi:hypothetical protein
VELSRRAHRIVVATAVLAIVTGPALPFAQSGDHRVGPSYLYPPGATPRAGKRAA